MSDIEQLQNALDQEVSYELWHKTAQSIVRDFSDQEWNQLQKDWKDFSLNQKLKLAEILVSAKVEYCIPILIEMITQKENDKLSSAAVEHLRSLRTSNLKLKLDCTSEFQKRIQELNKS